MFDCSQQRVLVVGDIMLDQYWQGECNRISPEAPVPVVSIKRSLDRAGGAANVALGAHALGARVTLIGIVGQDDAAQTLTKILEDHGVSYHFLVDYDKPTIKKLRVVEGHNHQMIRMDFESPFDSHADLLEVFNAQLAHADTVVISDYNKGTVKQAQALIAAAKKQGKRVVVDPKGTDFSKYATADVVTPNKQELAAVVGQSATQEHMTQSVRALLTQHNIAHMLVTLSEKGMLLVDQDSTHHIASQAREVADVTGAGDTVVATIACVWHGDIQLEQAVRVANIAAGIVVGKSGSAVASAEEVRHAARNPDAQKLLSQETAAIRVERLKAHDKRVVLTNGCFDLLHLGHVQYLREARQLGDVLVVAVNTDKTVSALKGHGRPVQPLATRMAMLAALEAVDYVVAFSEPTPHEIIKQVKPDILVKGGDYASAAEVVGSEIVIAYGGSVKLLSHTQDYSTSATIARILASYDKTHG